MVIQYDHHVFKVSFLLLERGMGDIHFHWPEFFFSQNTIITTLDRGSDAFSILKDISLQDQHSSLYFL